jgi:ParB/RepB/Spo0J family partition protein
MTYRILPLTSIIIERDERQRRELRDIDVLASSIRQTGLIHPVIIDDENKLIAGERRMAAHVLLGLESIATIQISDLDPAARERIELEENIKRSALTWKDECAAITRYVTIRKAEDPAITQATIAEELSISRTALSIRVNVQQEIEAKNPLVLAAETLATASNITARANERRRDTTLENISASVSLAPVAPGSVATETRPVISVPKEPEEHPLDNVDFNEWAPLYSGQRFNFIHCDFPYGIKADKHNQGAAKYFGGYADSPDVYWELIATLGDNINRLVSDSAHMIFWYSLDYHMETRLALEQMGWRVNLFPLIWFKNDNTGILPDPQRGPRRVYETAFFCSRGDRKIVQPVANCFPAPVTKAVHMSEKNITMLRHFFRMVLDDTTIMLDPTAGSSNALIAAKLAGVDNLLGLERDPEFFENAVRHYQGMTTGTLL